MNYALGFQLIVEGMQGDVAGRGENTGKTPLFLVVEDKVGRAVFNIPVHKDCGGGYG